MLKRKIERSIEGEIEENQDLEIRREGEGAEGDGERGRERHIGCHHCRIIAGVILLSHCCALERKIRRRIKRRREEEENRDWRSGERHQDFEREEEDQEGRGIYFFKKII